MLDFLSNEELIMINVCLSILEYRQVIKRKYSKEFSYVKIIKNDVKKPIYCIIKYLKRHSICFNDTSRAF